MRFSILLTVELLTFTPATRSKNSRRCARVAAEGSEQSADGFDWSTIDAAIQAIPAGNWTTYGDLADLGDTAAQPVGNYCASTRAPANAYRVLTGGGQVSTYFRWTDPSDTRDVRAVLEAEGIIFDAQDTADPIP
jgi:alkylated DNA nucleotide flippase Atl1